MKETSHDGYPALRLSDGHLTAIFCPRLGMVGASLTHRAEELLAQRNGLAAYAAKGSTMGIPLLYPWANRLSDVYCEIAGRQIMLDTESPSVRLDPNGLPIHGLLAANPAWEVTGDLQARFDFGAHPELLAEFPFPHELRIEVTLDASALTITTTVDANQDSPVPISFGFHPYLTLPDVPREEWHIEIPVEQQMELDGRGIPTGHTRPAGGLDGPLGTRAFDDAYTGITGPFVLAGGGRRIAVTFEDGYDYAQVYSPADQSLICFEPMTAATNALVDGSAEILEPGARRSASFRIDVTDT